MGSGIGVGVANHLSRCDTLDGRVVDGLADSRHGRRATGNEGGPHIFLECQRGICCLF